MSLSSFAVKAPVKVTMIFVAVLLLGYISLTRLPTTLFPDIKTPRVTATIQTRGLSSLEVEKRICETIERSLYTIRGVADVRTIARADSAVVVVEFTWDTPLDFAFLDVKKAVSDLQRDRADDIESTSVLRYDPNAIPVVTLAVQGPPEADLEDLRRLALNSLKPRFERLEGVANVVIAGGVERELSIALDETLLLTYRIDVSAVANALRQDNVNATGGFVDEGARRYLLKAVGEFTDVDQVGRVVVGRQGETPILLSDVARIEFTPKEAVSRVYLDGREAISMAFYKESKANTIGVADQIAREVEELQKTLPRDTKIFIANDQSQFIRSALNEVYSSVLIGSILSIAMLIFVLRDLRTTLIIAIAIPISIIATFNLMYVQGLTLNLMTLGGLALGSGMLVDNAIVVIENVFRLRQKGLSASESARQGTSEVGAAIIASTLTTIVVFLPIVYIEGVAALLFREQALTVTYSLLASLVVALLLIPMLSSKFLVAPPSMLTTKDDLSLPTNLYARVLKWSLNNRLLVMAVACLLSWGAYEWGRQLPREFLPRAEVRQVGLRLVAPSGTPIDATSQIAESVMNALRQFEPAVERVYVRVGENEGSANAQTEDPDGSNTAELLITLHNRDNPTTAVLKAGMAQFGSSQLVEAMKPTLERLDGVKSTFRLESGSVLELLGTSGAGMTVEIAGTEIETLSRLAAETQERLARVDGLLNVRSNILEGSPEVLIRLDKQLMAKYGFNVQTVGDTLRRRIDGEVATQIKREEGDLDLLVKVDYGKESLDTLRRISLQSSTGAVFPLEAIATFDVARGPREIVRRRQERIALVHADLDAIRLSEAITRAQVVLQDMQFPRGYSLRFTGEEERRRDAFGKMGFALILSIALVYMVMASIFESLAQPFLILGTIPMSAIGVVGLLGLFGQSLNVMAFIGIVMLGGIVVNNAIVLLDCVNQIRDANPTVGLKDSLLIGCNRRLRPVLMTTGTTLLGLLPLALGLGEGGELQQPMALAVLGGLTSSTVLTLLVIPVCQSLLDSTRTGLAAAWARVFRGKAPAATGEVASSG